MDNDFVKECFDEEEFLDYALEHDVLPWIQDKLSIHANPAILETFKTALRSVCEDYYNIKKRNECYASSEFYHNDDDDDYCPDDLEDDFYDCPWDEEDDDYDEDEDPWDAGRRYEQNHPWPEKEF